MCAPNRAASAWSACMRSGAGADNMVVAEIGFKEFAGAGTVVGECLYTAGGCAECYRYGTSWCANEGGEVVGEICSGWSLLLAVALRRQMPTAHERVGARCRRVSRATTTTLELFILLLTLFSRIKYCFNALSLWVNFLWLSCCIF